MSFEERLAGAVREAVYRTYGVELDGIHVERPNDPAHGDFATNVALANARVLRRNPREVAENLVGALKAPFVREADVAGPGFINFRLSPEALWDEVGSLLREGDLYGRREPSGDPVLLEFVSVNPTGPMHVGHGRQAAYGDSLARIMQTAGRNVSREYYFNDGGNQIRLFAESVAVRYARLYGETWPVSGSETAYMGDYTEEIAEDIAEEHDRRLLDVDRDEALREITAFATRWCMDDIRRTLARVRVRFDSFFNEKSLYESGAVEEIVRELVGGDHVYESEGALWLATSKFGDDKDRVLVKSDGSYTYMAPDLAYHRDKWNRGFRTAVDVLGADHAGYPPRIRAGLVALGLPREFLDVELVRLVKLVREGEQVKFSKRAGNVVSFDENPVFYVQYAHARISSIFERAGTSPETWGEVRAGDLAPEERLLVLELLDFPRVIQNAAHKREVHPIPTYLETLATRFHQFYTVHRVLVEDADVRARRLALCAATKSVLRSGLDLVGVNAPEKM